MAGGAGRAGAAHGCPAHSDLEAMLADPVHAAPGGSAHGPGGSDAPRAAATTARAAYTAWSAVATGVTLCCCSNNNRGGGGMLVGYGPVHMRWQ